MRTTSFLALLVVPCGMLACSALLGDFTVSPGGSDVGVGDTGSDVSQSDVTQSDASDAATLFELACTEGAKSQRIQVTQNDSLNADLIRIANIPASTNVRVVLVNYVENDAGNNSTVTLESYTIAIQGGNQITPASLPLTANQAFAITRYNDVGGTGFAVLYVQYDETANENYLWVAQIADSAMAWSPPVQVAEITSNNNLEADFTVIDSATNDYFIALSQVDMANQVIYGGEVKGAGSATLPAMQTFPVQSAFRNVFDITRPGVAFHLNTGYVMLTPDGNNGPPPVGSPVVVLESSASAVMVTPPSSLNYFPTGFVNATDPTKVNMAFLIANLNTLTGQYGVGQVAISSLGTLNPQQLPATIPTAADGGVAALQDLFLGGNSPSAHWETPPLSDEQFIVVQPTIVPGNMATYVGGVNLAWWDAPTGLLRAYAAGDGNLMRDVAFINNADATITGLVGSIAQIEVAYENAATDPSDTMNNLPDVASDLWLTNLSCFKK
jgi:hypothetical protein